MRQLRETDREAILSYISDEKEMNLFLIGDMECFGVDSETVSFYVTQKEGLWDALTLRYLDNYIIYSKNEEYQTDEIVEFLRTREIDCISGKLSVIKRITPFFPQFTLKPTFLSRCNQITVQPGETRESNIRKLTPEDVHDIVNHYLQIEEFSKTYKGKEEKEISALRLNMEHDGIYYGAYENQELVSVGGTAASNTMGAMIVGISTLPEYRKKGYASSIVKTLCEETLLEGKEFLCLFYDNPDAGSIYRRIGFRELGEYALFR